jgi:hypothetical protein
MVQTPISPGKYVVVILLSLVPVLLRPSPTGSDVRPILPVAVSQSILTTTFVEKIWKPLLLS